MGVSFSGRDWGTEQKISLMKTWSRVFRTSDWPKVSPSKKDNNPKHTAKKTQELVNSVNVLE